jgi:hypothetical protein
MKFDLTIVFVFTFRLDLKIFKKIILKMMKILFFLVVAIVVSVSAQNSKCGDNCLFTPGGCPLCPCGLKANQVDIASWCKKHTWDQACCNCIANAESKGNANAINYNEKPKSYDVGLWQINSVNWGLCNDYKAPCDPQANLNCAIKVYNWGGKTWKLWSTAQKCGCTTKG